MFHSILRSIAKWRVSSDRADGMFVQVCCYIGAVAVLACVGRLVEKFATTRFEILSIIFMDALLSIALVILGITAGCYANRSKHGASR